MVELTQEMIQTITDVQWKRLNNGHYGIGKLVRVFADVFKIQAKELYNCDVCNLQVKYLPPKMLFGWAQLECTFDGGKFVVRVSHYFG